MKFEINNSPSDMIQLIDGHDKDGFEKIMQMAYWSSDQSLPPTEIVEKSLNAFWSDGGRGVKLMHNDSIVGAAWSIPLGSGSGEFGVAVDPSYRQEGLAEGLMLELIVQLKGKMKCLIGRIHKENQKSLNLCEKLGFKVIADYGASHYLLRLKL